MKDCRPHAHTKTSAFTLVELLVVMVMLTIMMAAAAPTFVNLQNSSSLRAAARTMLATFQYTRSIAVSRQTEARIIFAEDYRSFYVETLRPRVDSMTSSAATELVFVPERTALGRERKLPVGITCSMSRRVRLLDEERLLGFHPNGSADEAIITVENRSGQKLHLAVNGVTGRVSIETDMDRIRLMMGSGASDQ